MSLQSMLWRFWRGQRAQDTLEMMLVTGTVVVLMIAGLFVGFQALVPEVVRNMCPAVDTGLPAGVPTPTPGPGGCLGP